MTEKAAANTHHQKIPQLMRSLIKARAGPGLQMAVTEVPQIGPREVLIRVDLAGICGTDVHIYEWDAWAASRVVLGTVIGHEFMGRVVRTGTAVRTVRPGDRVCGEGHIGCGLCYSCRTGQGHICDRLHIIGIDVDGCFADYVRIPEENVWRLHPAIPDEVGAIHDPLGNAVHTVMTDSVSGRTVLVVGAGTIGLLITAAARAAGALDVVTLDPNPRKLALARRMGASAAYDPGLPEIIDALRGWTRGGEGFDVMIEASGSQDGIRMGLRLLRNGGWAALLGIPRREVSLDLAQEIIFKGVTLYGINGRKMYETWYQAEEFLVHRKIDVDPVITHRLPFGQYEQGFDLVKQGEAIKVILDLQADRPKEDELL